LIWKHVDFCSEYIGFDDVVHLPCLRCDPSDGCITLQLNAMEEFADLDADLVGTLKMDLNMRC